VVEVGKGAEAYRESWRTEITKRGGESYCWREVPTIHLLEMSLICLLMSVLKLLVIFIL